MTVSYRDAEVLYQKGFTEAEISYLADAVRVGGEKDGQSQLGIDLSSEAWRQALEAHDAVQKAFFKANPDADYQDYDKFIDQWRRTSGLEKDPWIWIDQFYFRKQAGVITKAKWQAAYEKVGDLRAQLFMD